MKILNLQTYFEKIIESISKPLLESQKLKLILKVKNSQEKVKS